MTSSAPRSNNERTADYRARRRAAGYRLNQRWVLDLENPQILAELKQQCRAIANSPTEAEDQAYVDSLADWGDY